MFEGCEVGQLDGFELGLFGIYVTDTEGENVGFCVFLNGATEGIKDGSLEGTKLGVTLGLMEGTTDGYTVGTKLGKMEGTLLGVIVGMKVGFCEGLMLGMAEGDILGAADLQAKEAE